MTQLLQKAPSLSSLSRADFVFNENSEMFECLHQNSSEVITLFLTNGIIEPWGNRNYTCDDTRRCFDVFNCTEGHTGPLCAVCLPGYYHVQGQCVPCRQSVASEDGQRALLTAGKWSLVALCVLTIFFSFLGLLHQRAKRWHAMHHRGKKMEDGREVYFYTHSVERVKDTFRHVVESAARGRLMEVLGEKFRIILSLFQVVHHLPVTI